MKQFSSLIAATLVAISAFPAAHAQPAMSQRAAQGQGVILLTSGQVLNGSVTDEGNQLLVTLGPGSQMRLPRTQIDCTGRTLDDLFQIQHRRLAASDVTGRIELARWCLRTELPSAAGRVIVELEQVAPNDPRLSSLETQLRQYSRKPPEVATGENDSLKEPPLADELKDIAQQISPQAFDSYMRHVQPMILNHCSASGCHGIASKSEFQLLRPLTGDRVTQRMTRRNLHAVLAQVDRTTPLDSPLLAAATAPHAHFDTPLVSEQTDRRELEMLKAWLQAVGNRPAQATVAVTPAIPANVLPQSKSPPETRPTGEHETPLTATRPSPPTNRRQAFDAEMFNRKYFPERFTPADIPSP